MPNTACSGCVGLCAVYKHFSGFGFFLLTGIYLARPHTTNANRWAFILQIVVVSLITVRSQGLPPREKLLGVLRRLI